MNFINLVINECIKIFKKKFTLIFIILAIFSILFSCAIVYFKDYSSINNLLIRPLDNYDLNLNISQIKAKLYNSNGDERDFLNEKIIIYEYALEIGADNLFKNHYKAEIFTTLIEETQTLYSINKSEFVEQYTQQSKKVEKLWELLESGTFEQYIQFNKEQIEKQYNEGTINFDIYNSKLQEQDTLLKYEIKKYSMEDTYWKTEILNNNILLDDKIKSKFDNTLKIYLNEEKIQELQNQKLINIYRLENNIAPYYSDSQYHYNPVSYQRYKYSVFSKNSSVLFIGLLIIFISASCISEEKIKGTIKFLLISPCKRYNILIAKIISIIIVLIVTIIIVSQISVLVGNIVFGEFTNNYLYVQDGIVKVMSTNIYETLQYFLKIPELFIYMLFGMMLSTLTRNTAISTIITTAIYIVAPIVLQTLNNFVKIEFLKYLPNSNFDLESKILPLETYEVIYNNVIPTSLTFSIGVILVTSILLLVTIFESFNKKDI